MRRSANELASDLVRLRLMSQSEATEFVTNSDEPIDDMTVDQVSDWLTATGRVSSLQAEKILHDRVGELIIDGYVLIREIASGGMGQVFMARHPLMERTVAIKTLKPELVHHDELISRFHREIKLLSTLSHPNILIAHDAGVFRGVPYLVTEFVDGTDIQRVVEQDGPFPWTQAVGLFRQMFEAMAYAHDHGIIHRDIKPSNLILHSGNQVKILDLGLARLLQADADDRTRTGQILGTPYYMAPEQAGGHRVDHTADIYAFGRTLRFMIAGSSQFGGPVADREQAANDDFKQRVPPELYQLYSKMVAFDPQNRYQSLHSVLNDLQWSVADKSADKSADESADESADNLPLPIETTINLSQDAKRLRESLSPMKRWGIVALIAFAFIASVAGMLAVFPSNGPHGPGHDMGRVKGSDVGEAQTNASTRDGSGILGEQSSPPSLLVGHDGEVAFAQFTPDSERLLTGGWDGDLIVWNVKSNEMDWRFRKPHPDDSPDGLLECVFLNDAGEVAVGTSFGSVQIFDWKAKKLKQEFQAVDAPPVVQFQACLIDGGKLVTGTDSKKEHVKIWDVEQSAKPLFAYQPHPHGVAGIVYDPAQKMILTGGAADSLLQTYQDGNWRTYPWEDEASISDLAIAPADRALYVAFEKKLTRLSLDQPGQSVFQSEIPHRGTIWCVFAREGGPIATGGQHGYVVLWDHQTGAVLKTMDAFKKGVNCVAISNDGRWLAAGSDDRTIRLWQLQP